MYDSLRAVANAKVLISNPVSNYLLKVNRNTRPRGEIHSKLTVMTPEQGQGHCSGVFIVNFEHISHLVLVFLIANFEQVIVDWELSHLFFS